MEIPRNYSGSSVKLEGRILLARPNMSLIENWVRDGLLNKLITFAEVVACSNHGSDIEDLKSLFSSMHGNSAEFEAYQTMCQLGLDQIDAELVEQICHLTGRDIGTYRIFFTAGGIVDRWVTKLSTEGKEIGNYSFVGGKLVLRFDSPYDVMCREATNASPYHPEQDLGAY